LNRLARAGSKSLKRWFSSAGEFTGSRISREELIQKARHHQGGVPRVMIIGLEGSGKSSLVYRLKLGVPCDVMPTMGKKYIYFFLLPFNFF